MLQINPASAETIESSSMWALSEAGPDGDAIDTGDDDADNGIEVCSALDVSALWRSPRH